jgi:hypothetical protein
MVFSACGLAVTIAKPQAAIVESPLMPEHDDITTGDDGSIANRPTNPISPFPAQRLNPLAEQLTVPPAPRGAIIAVGVLHVLLGIQALVFLPFLCSFGGFVFVMDAPVPGAPAASYRNHFLITGVIGSFLAMSAILALAFPLGVGLIWRARSSITATRDVAVLTALFLSIALCCAIFSDFPLEYLSFFIPALIYLLSSSYLWFIARRGV